MHLKQASFKESTLKECFFTNVYLKKSDFSLSDLSGTLFHNCDISYADFTHAKNYHIDPRTNTIKKAKFSLPEAVGLLYGFDITIV